jgi:DNA transformation protein
LLGTGRHEFVDFVVELMQTLGPVEARRMFGGHGLFIDGLMFALVADATLYLKVDAQTVAQYTDQGLEPFTYLRRGKVCALRYYQPPEVVLEDQQQMRLWGNQAVDVALRAAVAKTKLSCLRIQPLRAVCLAVLRQDCREGAERKER